MEDNKDYNEKELENVVGGVKYEDGKAIFENGIGYSGKTELSAEDLDRVTAGVTGKQYFTEEEVTKVALPIEKKESLVKRAISWIKERIRGKKRDEKAQEGNELTAEQLDQIAYNQYHDIDDNNQR